MAAPKKKPVYAESPKPSEERDVPKSAQYSWKATERGLTLTLGLGKAIADRLEAAIKSELRIRDVGANELFASFLYHGLVHFEHEFPIREQKARAKKDGRPWVPPPPQGRLEGLKERLDNVESWLDRVKMVEEALLKGDIGPAKELARESIQKNTRLADAARAALFVAQKAMGKADEKQSK